MIVTPSAWAVSVFQPGLRLFESVIGHVFPTAYYQWFCVKTALVPSTLQESGFPVIL
jgi:hypothetical protein